MAGWAAVEEHRTAFKQRRNSYLWLGSHMTGKSRALRHISQGPEPKRAVWSCLMQRKELLGKLAAGNRSLDTQATHENETKLRGKYSLQQVIETEWGRTLVRSSLLIFLLCVSLRPEDQIVAMEVVLRPQRHLRGT